MALDPAANFVRGSTTSSIDGSATTLNVSDASIYPGPASEGAYNVVVWAADSFPRPDQDPDVEIMRVTARDTGNDTLSVSRGEEGTVGAGHPSGSAVQLSPTAKMFSDIAERYTAAGEDFDGQGSSRFQNLASVSTGEISRAEFYLRENESVQSLMDRAAGGTAVITPGDPITEDGIDIPAQTRVEIHNRTIKQANADANIFEPSDPTGVQIVGHGDAVLDGNGKGAIETDDHANVGIVLDYRSKSADLRGNNLIKGVTFRDFATRGYIVTGPTGGSYVEGVVVEDCRIEQARDEGGTLYYVRDYTVQRNATRDSQIGATGAVGETFKFPRTRRGRIQNNDIQTGGIGINVGDRSQYVVVRDNYVAIDRAGTAAIAGEKGTQYIWIVGNTVDPTATGIGVTRDQTNGHNTGHVYIRDNAITSKASERGIVVSGLEGTKFERAQTVHVVGNEVANGAGFQGIQIRAATDVVVRDNIAANGDDAGLQLIDVSDVTVDGGRYTGNYNYGIRVTTVDADDIDDVTISNADVSGNNLGGVGTPNIRLANVTGSAVHDNDCSNADIGVHSQGANSDYNRVHDNDVRGNATAGVDLAGANSVSHHNLT